MSEKDTVGGGETTIIIHRSRTYGVDPRRMVLWLLGVFILVVLLLALYSRPYYRYGAGKVWLEEDPHAVWNGLLTPPVFQIRVPPFVRARSWSPSPKQIRTELLRSYPELTDDELARIIRACVPVERTAERHPEV